MSREAMGGDYFFVDCGGAEIKNSDGKITAADLSPADCIEVAWDGEIVLSYPNEITAKTVTVTGSLPHEIPVDDDGNLLRRFGGTGYPETSDLGGGDYDITVLKSLEIICNFLESDIATAELTSIVYKDNIITGKITITDDTPYEYSEEQGFTEEMMLEMEDIYIITWHCGDTDREIYSHGGGINLTDTGTPAVFTQYFKEYITADEKDRPVDISITGFDGSFSFTIPAEK